ncbi:unnamed protein product [Caenorhabditis auriculariae]|uniref:Neurotransmitter-gated ion-channel transmembrane domain-containing protein n=1 Tax=Caenorhabditis auriculariae TaxID=2777116 RepID=A0A8S1H4E8_9PELO|nr:unnamed protein product [Caenorhabditis auriculariae]
MLRLRRPGVNITYATLPSLFCTKPKRHSESLIRNVKEHEASLSRSNSYEAERRLHQFMTGFGNGLSPLDTVQNTQKQIPPPGDVSQQATVLILQRIYHELKIMTKRMIENDREEQAANNWKFAAMVVDRLCLYVFTVFIIASTVGIFWSAPYLVA